MLNWGREPRDPRLLSVDLGPSKNVHGPIKLIRFFFFFNTNLSYKLKRKMIRHNPNFETKLFNLTYTFQKYNKYVNIYNK